MFGLKKSSRSKHSKVDIHAERESQRQHALQIQKQLKSERDKLRSLRDTGFSTSSENSDSQSMNYWKNDEYNDTLQPSYRITEEINDTKQINGHSSMDSFNESGELIEITKESLQNEIQELKKDIHMIRNEFMNEINTTKYDLMKEISDLKGIITQLINSEQINGETSVQLTPTSSISDEQLEAISKRRTQTSSISRTLKDSTTTGPDLVRMSSRLTQINPVSNNALSTPLDNEQINALFPLIPFEKEAIIHRRKLVHGTRVWVFERVQEWIDSDFNQGKDTLLAIVGEAGSGKTTICAALPIHFEEYIVAQHYCTFDRKVKSSPRNALLSLVNQLARNLPIFKSHLARLNLKYILEESDPYVLANKVLIDPLTAMEEPYSGKFILIDGLDQCEVAANHRNDFQNFLATILPMFPTWLGVIVASKPSPEFAQRLPITSVLDFSAKNPSYVKDTIFLLDEIMEPLGKDNVAKAQEILISKSGGNLAYLEFAKLGLSQPIGEDNGSLGLDILHDLPDSLYDIYEEIFEDKFGAMRQRIWTIAKPVLELIVAAASGPYMLISEAQVKQFLDYNEEDIWIIRRCFTDIVTIKKGWYRIECSAIYDWLTDPTRKDEHFYIDIVEGVKRLRQLVSKDTQGSVEGNPATRIVSAVSSSLVNDLNKSVDGKSAILQSKVPGSNIHSSQIESRNYSNINAKGKPKGILKTKILEKGDIWEMWTSNKWQVVSYSWIEGNDVFVFVEL